MAVEGLEETHENPETMEPELEMETETEMRKVDITDDDSSSSPRGVFDMVSVSSGTDSDQSNSSSNSCTLSEKSTSQSSQLVRGDTVDYRLQWKGAIESLMRKSMKRFATIPLPLMGSYDSMSKKSIKKKLSRIRSADDSIDCEGLKAMKPSWRSFDYKELALATDNFNEDNLVGKGGHAEVYKGRLPDGQIVAVKKLKKKNKEEEDGIGDFLSELGIIAHINHPNAAHLLGFGIDGGLHLVLQFSPQGSLASVLHGSEDSPPWSIRFKVALGVAEGLKYLHHGCQRRIIHRDIKASNILLTEDYEALLSDFGLAKWLPDKWAHHIVHPIEGTFGYLAPEYFMHGLVNEKTDVFAYGVLLLEIITGRHAVDLSRQSLVMWAKPLLERNSVKDLVDPRLGEEYNVTELKRAMFTASMCIHHLSAMRPDMNRVVQLLNGDIGSLELKQKSMTSRSSLPEGCDMEDYTCSTYLKELSRHKELALE